MADIVSDAPTKSAYKKKPYKGSKERYARKNDKKYRGSKSTEGAKPGMETIAKDTQRRIALSENRPKVYKTLLGDVSSYKAQTAGDIEAAQPGIKEMREENQEYIKKRIKQKKPFASN